MATINRVHGQAAAGAVYGYSPLVILVTAAGKFTADTVNGTTGAITDGGYAKAVQAVQSLGSIIWLGARASGSGTFACIVDQPSFNQGDGVSGSGVTTGFRALSDTLAANISGAYTDYVVTSGTVLAGDGTFTLA